MKKFIVALTFVLAAFSVSAFADTQSFNAYGAGTGLALGSAEFIGVSSLVFPAFTLNTTGADGLQLDAPGYFGATNYELLGEDTLTIDFNAAQSSFAIDVRDFLGYGGMDAITVYGADDTTVLNTYDVTLNGSIITFTDSGESAPIGAVSLSDIGSEPWTGILQSVSYGTIVTPEPGTLTLLGFGVLGLAGMARRKMNL